MIIFPYLAILFAGMVLVAYFARKGVTYDNRPGTKGSIGMAFFVVLVAMGLAWIIDAWLDWSVVLQYMWVVGGVLQFIAIAFAVGFALMFLSMLATAHKVGKLVA